MTEVATRDGDPGDRIGQRPAKTAGAPDDLLRAGRAGLPMETTLETVARLIRSRDRSPANGTENRVEAGAALFFRHQPVKDERKVRSPLVQLRKRRELLVEQFKREARVELRVVPTAADQTAILVLDQAMVRIPREGERVEPSVSIRLSAAAPGPDLLPRAAAGRNRGCCARR